MHQEWQEGDTNRVKKPNRVDYDNYISEHLKNRVFVDFEVLIKHVLQVPDDWRTRWGPAIEAVKVDPEFQKHHKEYFEQCDKASAHEKSLYGPLTNTANAVLDVLSRSAFDGISPKTPQYYRINDQKRLRGGVFSKSSLSPDIVLLHKDLQPPEEDLHWINPLHILEVSGVLCNGRNMPRLAIGDVDPILNHAAPRKGLRFSRNESAAPTTSTTASRSSNSRKRSAGGLSTADRPAKKLKMISGLGRVISESTGTLTGEEDEDDFRPKPRVQHRIDPTVQVCRYLFEMLSVPLLRSHATVSLVNCDRLQLYHANRSVVLVSSAINFSGGDGLSKFIALIIALNCLSLEKNGILDTLAKKNSELVKNSQIPADDKVVQKGNRLEFPGSRPGETFIVNLGHVIARNPAVIGRSTVVLEATSEKWPRDNLVVKISWPDSKRVAETEFLKRANEEAERTAGGWATKHLPRVFYATDVVFDESSAPESISRLFEDVRFSHGGFVYKRRTLRIIIQERLYPLKSLTNVRDIGQVILDIACIHRWLYDHPGILHRDLSPTNIMWRLIMEMNAEGKPEQKVYGVLTDYDLSSLKGGLYGDHVRTSQHRTGTPQYMAHELLLGRTTTHLYRHDLESLFYIMLLMGTRHTITAAEGGLGAKGESRVVMLKGKCPYQDWFDRGDYYLLGCLKRSFFSDRKTIKVSPAFADFLPWLQVLRYYLSRGFWAKNSHTLDEDITSRRRRNQAEGSGGGVSPDPAPFDDETLGGCVDYSTSIIEPTKHLEGELQGLIVRYRNALPLPTTIGTIQADAQVDY